MAVHGILRPGQGDVDDAMQVAHVATNHITEALGNRLLAPCACRYPELGLASCCSRFAGVVIATAQLVAIAQPALHAYGVDDSCHIRAVLFRFQPPGSPSIHAASCALPP